MEHEYLHIRINLFVFADSLDYWVMQYKMKHYTRNTERSNNLLLDSQNGEIFV